MSKLCPETPAPTLIIIIIIRMRYRKGVASLQNGEDNLKDLTTLNWSLLGAYTAECLSKSVGEIIASSRYSYTSCCLQSRQ